MAGPIASRRPGALGNRSGHELLIVALAAPALFASITTRARDNAVHEVACVVHEEPRDQEAVEAMWRLGFWSADWTPWRALSAIAHIWPQLRFETRPLYDQAA